MVLPSREKQMINYLLQRTLLSETDTNGNEERLYNDAMRSLKFVTAFSLFAVLFCSLSFYVYNRPLDGPNGNSIVSKIRKLPFLGWFFRQPQYVAQAPTLDSAQRSNETVGFLVNETDDGNNHHGNNNTTEFETDVELGETGK